MTAMSAVRRNVSKVIKIVLDDEQMSEDESMALIWRVAELVTEREELTSGVFEVSLSFADQDEMRQLNTKYRGVGQPTDVLAFPMYEDMKEALRDLADGDGATVLLGDVIICGEIAERQAKEYGHSAERELVYLFTHGLLHLLGYDHEDGDAAAMRAEEDEILSQLGLAR